MRRSITNMVLPVALLAILMLPAGLVYGQVGEDALEQCREFAFSTEEDFMSRGLTGLLYVSDGDLLGPNGAICARNWDLVKQFDIPEDKDLGLDAADVIDVERYLVAFSTELDSPYGNFTAGDLLVSNGAVIANAALTYNFNVDHDIGLDAVHFVGDKNEIVTFLTFVLEQGLDRDYWRKNPSQLADYLEEAGIDIWFSTEGTWWLLDLRTPFLDGDLLSARDGKVVAENGTLLPSTVPADIRNDGVDFGLDAFTSLTRDVEMGARQSYFSTEILYNDPKDVLSFSDGDTLKFGNGIAFTNWGLIAPFNPRARDLGLDALSFVLKPPPCEDIQITEIGGVEVDLIDPATGYARKDDGAYPPPPPPNPAAYDRPFGQWVSVRGNLPDPNCLDVSQYEYRVEYREAAGSWLPVVTAGTVTPGDPTDDWQALQSPYFGGCHPTLSTWDAYLSDTDGWISLEAYWKAKACKSSQALNVWNTSGKDGSFELRLGLRKTGDPTSEVTSSAVKVILDNTRPDPVQMALYDAAGTNKLSDQCRVTGPGTNIVVTIKGRARDDHFRAYELYWTGGDVHTSPSVPLDATEPADYRYYDSMRTDLDGTGTLPATATDVPLGKLDLTTEHNTHAGTDPPPCGYTITLRAWDRTIRGYFKPPTNKVSDGHWGDNGWWKDYKQSFCFEPGG